MLAQLTGLQAAELFIYLNLKAESRQKAETAANEARLREFFAKKMKGKA